MLQNPPPNTRHSHCPDPRPSFEEPWGTVEVKVHRRALILQDIHVPFHDNAALHLAVAQGKRYGVDTVVLNGDIGDFYVFSDWDRNPDFRLASEELPQIRRMLEWLRQQFPKARIVWKDGNHEERLWRYLKVKAPEFFNMPEFSLQQLLHFQRLRITYVGEMRPLKLGKLYLLHGHEYRFPITNPVNPARGLWVRAGALAACGHFHQTSQHSKRNLSGKVVTCWSFGCLCQLHPAYRPINDWNHGYGLLELDRSGVFELQNKRIIDGRAY